MMAVIDNTMIGRKATIRQWEKVPLTDSEKAEWPPFSGFNRVPAPPVDCTIRAVYGYEHGNGYEHGIRFVVEKDDGSLENVDIHSITFKPEGVTVMVEAR